MVVGMVTELIVFFLAEIVRAAPVDFAALRAAGAKRLRPILMSALIAILTGDRHLQAYGIMAQTAG